MTYVRAHGRMPVCALRPNSSDSSAEAMTVLALSGSNDSFVVFEMAWVKILGLEETIPTGNSMLH